jgi:DNA-binding CsgD family transcriptional regulator/PAS domain-containing protein
MDTPNLHTLIERIYDAALDAERWTDVARLFQERFDSPGAGLFLQDCRTQAFQPICLLGFKDQDLADYREYYARTNAWALAGLQRPGLTITDASVDRARNEPGAFAESKFCNDWMRPQGYRYGMGGTVKAEGTNYFHYTIMREPGDRPYGRPEIRMFDVLKPHLGRAVETGRRLRTLETQLAAQTNLIEQLPMGTLLVDGAGGVLHANRRARALLEPGDPLTLKDGYLVARGQGPEGRLQQTLSGALAFRTGQVSPTSYAFSACRADGTGCLSATAVPLSEERSLFNEPTAALAVFLSRPEEPAPIDRDGLQNQYGLSRTEARLTAQLARGLELKEAARRIGVSYETARGYLKTVLQKTGTGRQTELMRLLSDWALLVGTGAIWHK